MNKPLKVIQPSDPPARFSLSQLLVAITPNDYLRSISVYSWMMRLPPQVMVDIRTPRMAAKNTPDTGLFHQYAVFLNTLGIETLELHSVEQYLPGSQVYDRGVHLGTIHDYDKIPDPILKLIQLQLSLEAML